MGIEGKGVVGLRRRGTRRRRVLEERCTALSCGASRSSALSYARAEHSSTWLLCTRVVASGRGEKVFYLRWKVRGSASF